jgi:hypothetical protein
MKKLLFSLIILLCFTQCKPDDETTQVEPSFTLLVDEELKNYYYFPVGSWWIYERTDTNAQIYDTV